MQTKDTKTLVNFRAPSDALSAFDDACRLSGSTRTYVLNALMLRFTEYAAVKIPKQIAEQRGFGKTLRAAVERSSGQRLALAQQNGQSALRRHPRRSFTEFLADDPLLGKRS